MAHTHKPEWGPGVITSAVSSQHEGRACQMLTIRFERAGVKTISTAFANLVPASEAPPMPAEEPGESVGETRMVAAAFGLTSTASENKERLLRLPEPATDPFSTPLARLKATLDLYRFTAAPRSLLDWAAAQLGVADPLTRFNRHELEKIFEQFAVVRDNQLRKVAQEARKADPAAIAQVVGAAPPAGQQMMRRLDALR